MLDDKKSLSRTAFSEPANRKHISAYASTCFALETDDITCFLVSANEAYAVFISRLQVVLYYARQ